MGYTTDFEGRFSLNRQLTPEHAAYLTAFSQTRRMKRDEHKASKLPDPVRLAVGLPIGKEGSYFVGGSGSMGQGSDESILDYNEAPCNPDCSERFREGYVWSFGAQPGLWCQWVPSEDGMGIEWDGVEKFYNYTEWLIYLIEHFLKPWGYVLNGQVTWQGEDLSDRGTIVVVDNAVTTSNEEQ